MSAHPSTVSMGFTTSVSNQIFTCIIDSNSKIPERESNNQYIDNLNFLGKRRYNIKLWKTFTDCFNCLPVAAIVDEKIFCCHGKENISVKIEKLIHIYYIHVMYDFNHGVT